MGRLTSAPVYGRVGVYGLVALFTAAYSLYGIFRHRHFVSSAYDLGIYDQVIWHLSRFETPSSSLRGYSHMLGDHFSPVMALFAPLYWLVSSPETLIVAQALLLSASIVPVWLFLRTRVSEGVALTLSAAYALSWGIQQTAAFDVHEMAFAPLGIATLILAMDQRRWGLFWSVACVVAVTKEDLIPLLSGVGLYLLVAGERKHGGVLVVASLAWFLIVTMVVIPGFADAGAYGYTGAYTGVLRRPWLLPVMLVTPVVKVRTALLWFAPFAFVSLASPLSVLIVPLALVRMLSASPEHWGTLFHYTAPIAPIVAMAAGDGLARLARRRPPLTRIVPMVAALSLLLAAVLPGRPPLRRIFAPGHYRPIPSLGAARAALNLVPANASVIAQGAIAPHLSQRDQIYVLRDDARDADVIIASTALGPWPLTSVADIDAVLGKRQRNGYDLVFERDGWRVLVRRPQSSSDVTAPPP